MNRIWIALTLIILVSMLGQGQGKESHRVVPQISEVFR
jgi:hypothetical protein